ncbi:SDR family NAD(P)-dependent oxidoreductase, partial [Rhizobium johnstonii]
GERVVSCHADVSKSQDVQAMIDMAITHFGQLDILCNVAGITGPQGSLEDAQEEDFDSVIAVNIRGLFLSMKYALPHLVRDGGGVIVNISSATALVGMPGLAVYSATKGAIIATTRVIAAEYASKGVRAN